MKLKKQRSETCQRAKEKSIKMLLNGAIYN